MHLLACAMDHLVEYFIFMSTFVILREELKTSLLFATWFLPWFFSHSVHLFVSSSSVEPLFHSFPSSLLIILHIFVLFSGLSIHQPRFSNKSYLVFPKMNSLYKGFTIDIEFRSNSLNGLILYSGATNEGDSDFFAVVLRRGYLQFR